MFVRFGSVISCVFLDHEIDRSINQIDQVIGRLYMVVLGWMEGYE